MNYSVNEVIQFVAEEDVKFIRLAFCDVFGNQKNISIMPHELRRAFEYGISVDASAIWGKGGNVYSDLFLRPDTSTLAVLPWRPDHGRVVRMFCSVTYPNGKPFELDMRSNLKSSVLAAKEMGYSFSFGSEMEFYLFKTDENGNPTKIPHDAASYMDIAPDDKGENFRREVCLTLERMGIVPESSHHEAGPGQNEIDFRYSEPISAADNAITFRSVVNTIAAKNGLSADFSPKPLDGKPGSGFHINFSIKGEEQHMIMPFAIAGILEKIPDMTMFLNPTERSYKRFGEHRAPAYISWSAENRSPLIRIPAAAGEYKRAELRSPDPMANPYIAFSLVIRAALYGIKNKVELMSPANINMFTASDDEKAMFTRLPSDIFEAADLSSNSTFIREVLPEAVIAYYCDRK